MTKHLRFLFIALLMAVWTGAWAQTTVWSENWSKAKADDAPSAVNSAYKASSTSTKVYYNDKLAKGPSGSPELLLAKKNTTLTIDIAKLADLKQFTKDFTFSFYSNQKFLTVTANETNVKMSKGSNANEYVGTFSITNNESLTIVITNPNKSNNARIDDLLLTGTPASTKTNPALAFANASVDVTLEDKTTTVQTITTVDGFDGHITYESSNNEIATVTETTINLIKEGEVDIIAKSDETKTYAAGTASYKLVIKSNLKDPELAFKEESYNIDVNDGKFFSAEHLKNPNSVAVKYAIDPASENVEITADGEVTVKATGEYTITAKFAGDDTYKLATATCKLVVTNGKVVFYESFNKCDGIGGNDGKFKGTGTKDPIYDNTNSWKDAKVNAAAQCIKIGSGSSGGNVTSPSITTIDKVALLTFNLASWEGDNSNVTITINNGTLGYNGSFAKSFTLTPSDSKFDNVEMIVKASSPFTIDFSSNEKDQRFFLDEVKVTEIKAKTYTFKETSDNNIVESYENANVTLNRSHLVTNSWNTFCVPFAISAEEITTTWGEGTELRTFDRMSGNTMYFKKAESIEAGKPYLVKPTKTTDGDLTFNGVQTVAGDEIEVGEGEYFMVGTYNAIKLAEDGSHLFLSTNNEFKRPMQNSAKMKGMRVYFKVPANTKPAALHANIDGVETGINAINGIEVDTTAPVYNLQGQCVGNSLRSLAPGIYVQGGKKYVVK